MKQQVSETSNGVRVENTLSMSLQNQYPRRRKLWLILTAFAGVIGSIFSFLTMFTPMYSLPVILSVIVLFFAFFTYSALRTEHLLPVLIAVLLYCGLFFWQKDQITNGLMYLTNDVCQAIYMTDWEYFITDDTYTEIGSVTCVLCFLIFPIIWMICYAVLRYQNFFLSLLVTFPFIEIGLFFGIIPDHFFAVLLASFWFAMASVQAAGSGINQSGGKTGFLRKKNAFFPVASMRFMLPELTGLIFLVLLMTVFGFSETLLKMTNYERPETFKNLRSDFQNYLVSLHLTDDPLLDNYGNIEEQPDDLEHIPLGSLDEKIYENIPVTSIAFSENPETRIYLKYRTGHVYNGANWTVLPEEIYQNPDLAFFETLDYYPPEFLYSTISDENPVQMSLYHTTGILSQCIPYGFQKNKNILCQKNDMIQTNTNSYTIQGHTDYEALLSDLASVYQIMTPELLESCETEKISEYSKILNQNDQISSVWISQSSELMMQFYGGAAFNAQAAEAGILCGSFYDDFVYEHYTVLPDTPAMAAVRGVYADLLDGYDAKTASPYQTILLMQNLRDKVCENVIYTLSPGKTPSNMDHTAYFLLENHKGYCEHYATAGTVLARMAGIPARYCEGYMIDCSRENTLHETALEDNSIVYTSELLDSNAHAWTEIYISGLGWIPFEFTFSYFTPRNKPESPVPATAPPETVPHETHPVPTELITETEPVVPVQKEIPQSMLLLIIFLTIAAVLCLLILIFRVSRLFAIRKRQQNTSQDDRRAAALCVYHYLTAMLSECGVPVRGTTIGELAEESEIQCSQYMNPAYSLSSAVQIGAKLRYSPHPMSNSELRYLMQTADSLAHGMYEKAGFFRKFYLKWLRHYL
ncbi:MAG: hypothetical protein IJ642_07525 [Oscillospiraceae bacterium]|nr:hypothetical protein [Oscillospiraceae bacterium]